MAKLERIYTVPLGDAYETVRNKRTPRAVKILRAFIARHMKSDGARILLSENLNMFLWGRSIQKPPRRVKVRLVKDEGVVRAYLSDEKAAEPKKAEAKKEDKKAGEKPAAKAEPAGKKPESAPAQPKEKKEGK